MAIFKLIEPDHWTLKVPVDQCSTELDKEELARDLIETMKECSGLGLSATQVGVRERAFVMYKDLNKRETMACFNPHILEYSEEKVLMDEGCLSYPGLWLKISRPSAVIVEFENESGTKDQFQLFGLESRVFQHEMDHMQGKDFRDHVSKLKLNMAIKRMKKQQKKVDRIRPA
jgi:peptide deformylase|tara:strand:- start:505 stop:1023 length:519 start_codon:yes stop_codon:yes gene_type:complete